MKLPGVKWLDNHKAVFSVAIKYASTAHTFDAQINAFLDLYFSAKLPRSTVDEHQLSLAIRQYTCNKEITKNTKINYLYKSKS